MPRFEAAKYSLTGERPMNQDRCLFLGNAECALLGLADGLGGHPRGDAAAQLMVDVTEATFRAAPKPLADPARFMLLCVARAHAAIRRFGARQAPPVEPRTTAVFAVVQQGRAQWSHVGDSRCYLVRDGRILGQTRDHVQITMLRTAPGEPPRARANLTRCLGGVAHQPLLTCAPLLELQPGDTLLLCSDGLWSQLPRDAIASAFGAIQMPLQRSLRDLVERAARAPNSDNVSGVALRWRGGADDPGRPS